MKNNMWKKGLVLVIIMLFIGASAIVPNIKILTNVENVFSARAMEVFDGAPNTPSQPSGNTSGYICIDYNYNTSTTDPGGLNVSYGWDWDGDLIVDEWTDWYESNETCTTAHNWSDPGDYNISVKAKNTLENESNFSAPLNVTMLNHPPNEPSNPSPPDGATNVSVVADLSWTGGDPDSCDTVTYDVYFGTNSTPPKVAENLSGTVYDPGKLDFETMYYWMIIAWDNHNTSTEGPIWNFTTRVNNPPNEPSNPSPPDGATDVDVNAYLSWTCSDPDEDDLTYDVYFEADDSTPDELVSENQSSTTYDPPGIMEYNTHYFWKVVAWDNHNASNESQIWNFTTEKDPHRPPTIELIKPLKYDEDKWWCYFRNKRIGRHPTIFIIGYIDLEAEATDNIGVERVEFYIDNHLKGNDTEPDQNIYQWTWNERIFRGHTIKVVAIDTDGNTAEYSITVFIINFRFLSRWKT